jgi:hypothetical protein
VQQGQFYYVRYRIRRANGSSALYSMTARYLGPAYGGDEQVFDLRPEAGNVRLQSNTIESAKHITGAQKVKLPRLLG